MWGGFQPAEGFSPMRGESHAQAKSLPYIAATINSNNSNMHILIEI